MRYLFVIFFFGVLLSGCKSKPINQKIDHKKEGVWMDDYTQDSVRYKSFEYYKHDEPVKKWKSLEEKFTKRRNTKTEFVR